MKGWILFKLYRMGLIRRETPLELIRLEDVDGNVAEPVPGFYIWCNRDYSRLHFRWIRGDRS